MISVQNQTRIFQSSVLRTWQAICGKRRPRELTKLATSQEMAPKVAHQISQCSHSPQAVSFKPEQRTSEITLHQEEIKPTDTGPTFHPFPRLPPELREQIWHLTMPPRVIHLSMIRSYSAITRDYINLPIIPISRTNISIVASLQPMSTMIALPPWESRFLNAPVALHICRESREIALGRYELAFPRVLTNGLTGIWRDGEGNEYGKLREGTIWVDFRQDNFCVNNPSRYYWDEMRFESTLLGFSYQNQIEVGNIRNLTVVGTWASTEMRRWGELVETLKLYKSLRSLTVVYSSMGRRESFAELEVARVWMEGFLEGIWEEIGNGDAAWARKMPSKQVLTCAPGK